MTPDKHCYCRHAHNSYCCNVTRLNMHPKCIYHKYHNDVIFSCCNETSFKKKQIYLL